MVSIASIILLILNALQVRAHYVLLLRFNLRTSYLLFLMLIVKDLEIALIVVQLSHWKLVLRSDHLAIIYQVF